MSTPKYRLVYFDVRALGEPIRWLFNYAGVEFVDERIPWDYPTWFAKTKQNYFSTVGQVPVLYEDGKPELGQSQAISRYLAKQFNLTGDNIREDAKLDEIISQVFDLFIWWRMYLIFEKDPERKKANRMLVDGRLSAAYTTWNRVLVESQGPYILGNKLTHADFWLAHFVSVFDDPMEGDEPIMPPGYPRPNESDLYVGFSNGFPALKAHKERIHALPEIKAWIEKRHKTIA
ncbi:glutathione S-transferase 1 [Folsomia candida]|uniref:Glutathione S-transferase 1 n=1 Tax=Folsomia candida TaxID=158441 RepID=A0A226EUJ5_FOLCA|nr:glutathione S-transferase 1 [Folsomia candida]OXA60888.1 Glutathione S-transferase 1 [Folsomia candida]